MCVCLGLSTYVWLRVFSCGGACKSESEGASISEGGRESVALFVSRRES